MDGNGSLFGTLSGNTREVLHKFTVELPKKHGRGGQSALRFARLRLEKRHNYVRKASSPPPLHLPMPFPSAAAQAGLCSCLAPQECRAPCPGSASRRLELSSISSCQMCSVGQHHRISCVQVAETATQFFIAADRPNVAGLVLAGSADFKTELSQSDMFDQRLQAIVLSVVDVSYGAALSESLLSLVWPVSAHLDVVESRCSCSCMALLTAKYHFSLAAGGVCCAAGVMDARPKAKVTF